ncbi:MULTISPECIES: hypothetical protein [unclassified Bradyrhizobium]|uniref:hypothetical protein n=1 Tax=unclassified Bradyrhizobium TaxID=2631580 RepID=UPI002478F84F|nr:MULTISPECIES: hypothetical protein [unclassified Bradyrhizobium]WGR74329.1 hypothetical protein MTX24_16525 [Bradyrhizobium sp. ISRA426]WGR79164.1 hypothetical protein MTX21_01640 [Bradyrhizobium sp. ISRA430]WGR90585.1 hypothetical protein MTX25_39785 [Bradyrhizobium sp. ISRA432]
MVAARHPLRDRIIARVRRGEIANVREMMLVASIPRQTANRWLREAGIDLSEMRLRLIAKMHTQEELYLAGRSGMKRPTAAQQRRDLLKSVRRFNAANAKEPGSARAKSSAASEVERAEGVAGEMPGLRAHGDGLHDAEAPAAGQPEVQ